MAIEVLCIIDCVGGCALGVANFFIFCRDARVLLFGASGWPLYVPRTITSESKECRVSTPGSHGTTTKVPTYYPT